MNGLCDSFTERQNPKRTPMFLSTPVDGVASTADFESLASGIAGRDLSGFFEAWLYGEKTPPMPGHPDWKSDAPQAPQSAG